MNQLTKLISDFTINKYKVLSLLIVLGLLLYSPIINIGYISDDWRFVYQMENFGWDAFKHNLADEFFIPLSHVLGAIFYQITGGNPIFQHIVQVLVHSICAFQIFLLISHFSDKPNQRFIAITTSLLFLCSVFNGEGVIWLASKSYGYCLLFSLLALRTIVDDVNSWKKQLLFTLFTLCAILCKEWAYMIPFIAYALLKLKNTSLPSRLIGLSLGIICLSLAVRFIVLGTFIGGYGIVDTINEILLKLISTPLIHLVKLTSFYRYAGITGIAVTGIFMILFIRQLIKGVKLGNSLYFLAILFLSILPMALLEITSLNEVQSDRYSYFYSIPVYFGLTYLIFNTFGKKQLYSIAFSTIILFINIIILQFSIQDWRSSSKLQYFYLEELNSVALDQETVFLINCPDTYKGIYCLRNGIEPYLKVKGKEVFIDVFYHQNFKEINGGIIMDTGDFPLITPTLADNRFVSYPKEQMEVRLPFDAEWLEEFDKAFYFENLKFKSYSWK